MGNPWLPLWMNVCALPEFICWSPSCQCGCICIWVSKEVIKIKWGHKNEPFSNRISIHIKRDTRESSLSLSLSHLHTGKKMPCENTVRRWLSASQKEKSHQKLTILYLGLRLWTLRTVRKINFCCSHHPVCGILLR